MKKETPLPLQNPSKRELSPFFAKELLYDYVSKNMDPLREKSMLRAIEQYPELRKSLDDIVYGMSYCHHLSHTSLAPESKAKLLALLPWTTRLKESLNFRTWNKSTLWVIEALFLGSVILVVSLKLPLSRYLQRFLQLQHPGMTLAEQSRDTSLQLASEQREPAAAEPIVASNLKYQSKAELQVANPNFTFNKLQSLLPRLGASIDHQSVRETPEQELSPFLKISIPSNQTEALFTELKAQGQLTWLIPPEENDLRGSILGLEVWIVKEKQIEASPTAPKIKKGNEQK